jgi:nucleoside-diphosphate-sugar epimerase
VPSLILFDAVQIYARNSVLVTGAEGFLGRALVRLLERYDQRVIALDSSEPERADPPSGVTKVRCDITDQQQVEKVFREYEIGKVVHLAAILPTVAQRDPVRATRVNVVGSMKLLQLAREFGVARFVFGSSLSIYGNYSPDYVVSENDRAAPEDIYGAAKLYVEQLGQTFTNSGALQFVSLRIGRIVGPGARSTTSAWRSGIFELLQTKSPANVTLPYVGSERVLLIHVQDAAGALMTLLQAPRPAHCIYNAPCESWVVNDLKLQLESLNPNIRVALGDAYAKGNPRLLDWTRFKNEFAFSATPMADRLQTTAGI